MKYRYTLCGSIFFAALASVLGWLQTPPPLAYFGILNAVVIAIASFFAAVVND